VTAAGHRKLRANARMSSTTASGCSSAVKWPPRGCDHVERVAVVAAVCRGVGQRPQNVLELDGRPGPTVGEQERSGVIDG
jgi:hypothetical protein